MDVLKGYDFNAVVFIVFQESPMPDPPELFTNIYVKDSGLEVIFSLGRIIFPALPFLNKLLNSHLVSFLD